MIYYAHLKSKHIPLHERLDLFIDGTLQKILYERYEGKNWFIPEDANIVYNLNITGIKKYNIVILYKTIDEFIVKHFIELL